jgi:hypothetical protein
MAQVGLNDLHFAILTKDTGSVKKVMKTTS